MVPLDLHPVNKQANSAAIAVILVLTVARHRPKDRPAVWPTHTRGHRLADWLSR
jgi:hypothetical protein